MADIKNLFNRKSIILDGIISLAIITIIIYLIGIDKIISEFSNLNYFDMLLAVIFLLIMYVIMVARLIFILKELGVKLEFWKVFKMHMVGMLLADFTPARTGYLMVAYGLTKKYRVPEEKSTVAVLGPQIYDFMAKVILGTIAMLYLLKTYLNMNHGEFLFLGAFALSGIIAVMVLLLFSKKFLSFFSFARKIQLADKLISIFEKAQQNSKIIISRFPELFVFLILSWISKGISWYFVAKSLDITLKTQFPEPIAYLFLQPLLTILEFIPSPTLAGLGLSEGGGILVFSLFGIEAAKAASFVFLARVKTIIINLISIHETLSIVKS